MSTFKPKSIWTAFITAFFALLASLGLATATTSAANAATQPSATTQEHTAATTATPLAPSVRWTLPRDRALPPTMKQRIRAEAHGSSPATRHLPADPTAAARTTGSSHHTAPEGDSPVPPP
ncbi:DUF6344 domain-containing protein [Kitasatospora albolonga]|uniref:DUF6344 domain-containing protein n=2 Tax=Streptomycetaceae TaxID=2062 RepID=A0ABU2VVV2_9ACTN|nr:DUF6344 domain-containing protein [Streptomyces griseus]ARF73806.1 hypothetical protein B7C62_17195 [Kitasatospora albolonga]MDT0489464.1 DUF6344 domain-containing protein [Streptomyces griseus]